MASLLVQNALVHDGLGGTLPGHDVRVEQGKIAAVGKGLPTAGARCLDAAGLELFPGFIAALAPWGGVGPALGDNNLNEHSGLVTPELDVTYAFQPDSITFQQLPRWGVTATCLAPGFENLFGGSAAVYKTYAESYDGFLLRPRVFAAASFDGSVKATHVGQRYAETDMGLLHLFRQTLAEGQAAAPGGPSYREQALADIAAGRLPLVVSCGDRNKWQKIRTILAAFPRVRYILTGLYGMGEADLTGAQGAILYSMADAGYPAQGGVDFAVLRMLLEKGVPLALSPYLNESLYIHAESLLWNAALLHKNGIEAEQVVRMLCAYPARLLGVEDRVGSIRPGLDADFSLWEGNPIQSFAARQRHLFLNGQELDVEKEARFCW